MSKKQAPTTPDLEAATTVEPEEMATVRALVDAPAYGLLVGKAVSVPASSVAAMKAAGMVDDHPDAVAYAESQNADEA